MLMMPTEAEPVVVVEGDCLEALRTMPDGFADAVLTDPPYGLDFPYASYTDTRDNLRDLIAAFMPEVLRVAPRVYVTPGQSQIGLYPPADWMLAVVWNTTGSFGAYGYSQWMPVLAYGKDLAGFGRVNKELKADVLAISGGAGVGFQRGDEKEQHPCPKPLNVMRKLIRRLTMPGDVVIDPFGGTGTTAAACVIEGRRCVLIEKEPKYAATARRRVAEAMGGGLLAGLTV